MAVNASIEASRRTALRDYAQVQLQMPNKAQAMLNIIDYAVELSRGATTGRFNDHSRILIDDLMAVIIGNGFTDAEGRGTGPYYVGSSRPFRGATGFQADMRDTGFQVQHAIAGLVIGFRYGIAGEAVARIQEAEPQDDRLYAAMCTVGEGLAGQQQLTPTSEFSVVTYINVLHPEQLAVAIRDAICDDTCTLPSGAESHHDYGKPEWFGSEIFQEERTLFENIQNITEKYDVEQVSYPSGIDSNADGIPDMSVETESPEDSDGGNLSPSGDAKTAEADGSSQESEQVQFTETPVNVADDPLYNTPVMAPTNDQSGAANAVTNLGQSVGYEGGVLADADGGWGTSQLADADGGWAASELADADAGLESELADVEPDYETQSSEDQTQQQAQQDAQQQAQGQQSQQAQQAQRHVR